MTNNQLTKEWLQNRIADMVSTRDDIPFGFDESGNNELAAFKLALAAMDSEPDCKERKLFCSTDTARMRKAITVSAGTDVAQPYRHAQPALVIPDEMTAEQAYEIGYYYGDPVNVFARGANWMRQHIIDSTLAAAQHDTPALNSVLSVVTVPGKWIPVSERMPEKGQAVLVYRPKAHEGGDSDVRVAVYGRHNFEHGFGCYWEPSHWMPLPAAPQEVGDA